MSDFQNVMQVFTLLDKSNCRRCGEKTCLAFASRVFKDEKDISSCPTLSSDIVSQYTATGSPGYPGDEAIDQFNALIGKVRVLDLDEAASRVGGKYNAGRLTIKILGKDFSVDQQGEFYSDIHMTPWVTVPFLSYILECRGDRVTGDWVSLRELDGGMERYPLFKKRCEEGMKRIADVYTDLFDDMVHLFQGHQVKSMFNSDISVVLPIFPYVPLMICYWKADEGMESSLNIFFDRSVNKNLGAELSFSIGAGITQMFEKIALQHGFSAG